MSTDGDRGRIAPNGCLISRLAGITADGGEGKDAAVEASVTPSQKEGVLTEGGWERENPTPTEPADTDCVEDFTLRDMCSRAESCKPSLGDGVE